MPRFDQFGVEITDDKVGFWRYLLGFLMMGFIGLGVVAASSGSKDGWLGIKIIIGLWTALWLFVIVAVALA